MRLFIALWPSPAERRRLAQLAGRCVPPLRPVPPADLHLTLAFLGEVAPAHLHRLAGWLGSQQRVRLPVVLTRLEAWQDGRLAVATGPAPAGLRRARARMVPALRALGCRPDPRPFRAHVTLARSPRGAIATARPWAGGPLAPPLRLEGGQLALVASGPPRGAGGARYRVLAGQGVAAPGQAGAIRGGCAIFRAGIRPYMY